jgi:hypothetical protein
MAWQRAKTGTMAAHRPRRRQRGRQRGADRQHEPLPGVEGEAAHRTALNKAIDDLANGRPVDVDGIVSGDMLGALEGVSAVKAARNAVTMERAAIDAAAHPELPFAGSIAEGVEVASVAKLGQQLENIAESVGARLAPDEGRKLAEKISRMNGDDALVALDEFFLRPNTLLETLPPPQKPPSNPVDKINKETVNALRDDLTPAKIEEARLHPDMEETVARDLDKLMLERPDLEVPTGVTSMPRADRADHAQGRGRGRGGGQPAGGGERDRGLRRAVPKRGGGMSVLKCVTGLVQAGKITKALGDEALALYERSKGEFQKNMGPAEADAAAALATARAMEAGAKRLKNDVAKQAIAFANFERTMIEHPDGPIAGVLDQLTQSLRSRGTRNVDSVREDIWNHAVGQVRRGAWRNTRRACWGRAGRRSIPPRTSSARCSGCRPATTSPRLPASRSATSAPLPRTARAPPARISSRTRTGGCRSRGIRTRSARSRRPNSFPTS